VEHIKSPVIQSEDFYPFGLSFNSYSRENSLNNRWKFQGQEHIDELGVNWDSFKWRNHQPEIGRFFNVDPLSEKYVYNSPYAFSENKVTGHVELEGLESAKAATDQALGTVRSSFEYLFGTTFDDGKKAASQNESTESDEKNKKSKGVGISVNGEGGPNESDLPEGDPEGEQLATESNFWEGIFGALTKSRPSKTRGPLDRYKNVKSASDNASDASESKDPAAPDSTVAWPGLINNGVIENYWFVTNGV
jgi:RHS repeat-associated protein